MKTNTMGWVGAALCLATATASAQEAPLSEEQQILLRAAQNVTTRTETVSRILDYCTRQDAGFAATGLDSIRAWRQRNQAYVDLGPALREETYAMGVRQFGVTREEAEAALMAAVEEVAGTFAEEMEQVDEPARRRHACDAYARKISDGELDIGFERPEVKAMLDARLDGTRKR
ncbi:MULTISPECIES: hypothetical protein [unclassified Pseudoxanthomonas]|jgi:hypothetical protein|uniref:hypothetical protein n=1 Tax=unclassified Pseudoxanthomonas TaxID=2645906 RepID=UPI0011421EEA|nr:MULTISPECIES: hypothetical protein [unclassified Pseudoxanthomonas]MBB3274514.1 nucleoid-associated protein YgaU [Pseudoxanthomonas sp. OG2]MBD9378189.1 hypothetical protein [Pseudoxanthomonas sp. PXM04]MBV7475020.1 hypothetical protein [Pseudoxanthomonas sp. PXM05]UBB27108.1 hypothetical protein LAG73_08550 [Pseudoxanthomonas japonensis]